MLHAMPHNSIGELFLSGQPLPEPHRLLAGNRNKWCMELVIESRQALLCSIGIVRTLMNIPVDRCSTLVDLFDLCACVQAHETVADYMDERLTAINHPSL